MTDRTQPEALRLALSISLMDTFTNYQREELDKAAAELCRQHARIAELEAQLESIGAGGVNGPLMGKPQEMPDLTTLTERGAKAWAGVDAQGLREGAVALCSPHEGMVEGWIALPGPLPEPGTPVLLDIGKKYPLRAMWAAKHTVQAADDDTDWGEYVEEDDMYYAPEGWYEWNEHEDTNWAVSATPRAWAPLPPTSPADSRKGE